ncbi:amidohydrolase family protein [Saccharomonospora sp. NPDC046836]|uniref:amidohydrolase family protein n=1 Tax=Saccharomonospora sp. NPDC046836 TaxID=3156921 RepID=UPI0033CE9130
MWNGQYVIDTVLHAFNLDESNFAVDGHARPIAELTYNLTQTGLPSGYPLSRAALLRDWPVHDVAAMTFGESETDFAVYHPTPIFAFSDGMSSADKAVEILERYPDRMLGAYVALDPLTGKEALAELDRRCAQYRPLGVKLYPTSWRGDTVATWRMDDPQIAFPIYEAAAERGIRTIAVHKAVPLGPAPTGPSFHPGDVEGAAAAFPELNFEIVHGGAAFTEETAWLLGRYENIYVNLETLTVLMLKRPDMFARLVIGMCHVGGAPVLDRMVWSSGAMQVHPRLCLEVFEDVKFPDSLRAEYGLFSQIPEVTQGQKNNILGSNYARMHGIDIEARLAAIAGDEFSRAAGTPLPAPFSTTSVAGQVIS